MFGPERAVASLSREKAGCEEWAALSEKVADLQASPDEEIRRLTDLCRTGCRPHTLKGKSRNSSCAPRPSLWRLFSRIAVRRSPNLKRLDALSERRGCEGTRTLD